METIERTIAPISAEKKVSIAKPDTNCEVVQSMSPLMMRVKRPRVKKLIGSVMSSIIGRITIFTIPRIRDAQIADENEERCIPLITFAVIIRASALTRSFMIRDIC